MQLTWLHLVQRHSVAVFRGGKCCTKSALCFSAAIPPLCLPLSEPGPLPPWLLLSRVLRLLPSSSFQIRLEMQKVAASCSFTLECPCRKSRSQKNVQVRGERKWGKSTGHMSLNRKSKARLINRAWHLSTGMWEARYCQNTPEGVNAK